MSEYEQSTEANAKATQRGPIFEQRAGDPKCLKRLLDRPAGEPPRPGDELPPGYKQAG